MVPFTDILRQIRKGIVVDELDQAMLKVNEAVIDTGKAGEITLKIKIKPMKGDSCQVTLTPVVSFKKPQADLPDGIFFLTGDGDLVRNDPNQSEMFVATERLGDRAVPDAPYTPPPAAVVR